MNAYLTVALETASDYLLDRDLYRSFEVVLLVHVDCVVPKFQPARGESQSSEKRIRDTRLESKGRARRHLPASGACISIARIHIPFRKSTGTSICHARCRWLLLGDLTSANLPYSTDWWAKEKHW